MICNPKDLKQRAEELAQAAVGKKINIRISYPTKSKPGKVASGIIRKVEILDLRYRGTSAIMQFRVYVESEIDKHLIGSYVVERLPY